MRIFASSIVMMFVALVAWGDTSIFWLNPTHDFGAFKEDSGKVTCVFKGVNIADCDISIVNARATCGCTTPKYSYKSFAPGDTISVTVSYDPSGRPGRFSKKVYITNSRDESKSELMIKGVVIGNKTTLQSRYPVEWGKVRLLTDMLNMGDLSKGVDKGMYVTAYNQTVDTIVPKINNLPSYVQASIIPTEIPPGEQATIAIHLLGRECDKWGPINEVITFTPDKGEEALNMNIIANILPNFTKLTPGQRMNAPVVVFDRDRVELGTLNQNGDKVTIEANIKNEGKDVLEIYRAYTIANGVDVKLEKNKVKGGKSAKIFVTFDPSQYKGEVINEEIIFVVNDPSNPQARLRIVGELKIGN